MATEDWTEGPDDGGRPDADTRGGDGSAGADDAGATFTTDRRFEALRGGAFRAGLAGATLLGVISLVVLVAYVLRDAIRPSTGDLTWYAVWVGSLLVPAAVAWWALRRDRDRHRVAGRIVAALLGGPTLGLVTYVIVDALSPYEVLAIALPPAVAAGAVLAVGRLRPDAAWTGPATPLAIIGGLGIGGLLRDPLVAALDVLAIWIVFLLLVGLPAGAVVGHLRRDADGPRRALAAAAATVAAVALAGAGGLFGPYDPVVGVIGAATVLVPAALVVEGALRRGGLAGLAFPVVVGAGAAAAVVLTARLGATPPDTWFTWTLFTEAFSTISPERAGYYPQIVGSILLVGLMAVLIFPLGVCAAIYLEEYAPQTGRGGRVTQLVQVNISNLAGVPSVVYGLLGLGLFVKLLGMSRGLLIAASATLGLLILPIVIVSAQEAIRAVPESRRQAAYGLGASRWQTVRDVVLPEAFPGILTGTILALGRAIGETAPILVVGVATSATSPPGGLFEKATALPLQIFAARAEPEPAYRYGVLAAGVVILLALMLSMNAIAIVLRNRYQRS